MKINLKKLFITLLVIQLVFFALHMIFRTGMIESRDIYELASFFSADLENSLPTWYSVVVLLFGSALLLFYIGWCKKKAGAKYYKNWIGLGAIFVFLSIDDSAMFHERLGALNRVIGLQPVLDGINPYVFAWSWWVIFLPAFMFIGIFFIKWFFDLPNRTKALFVASAFLLLLGQVGGEMLSSYLTHSTGEYPIALRGVTKLIGKGFGFSLFLWSIVDYIHRYMPAKERRPIKIETE